MTVVLVVVGVGLLLIAGIGLALLKASSNAEDAFTDDDRRRGHGWPSDFY